METDAASLLCDSLNESKKDSEADDDDTIAELNASDEIPNDEHGTSDQTCESFKSILEDSATFEENSFNISATNENNSSIKQAKEAKKLIESSLSASLKKEMEMKAKMSPRKNDTELSSRILKSCQSTPESVQQQRNINVTDALFTKTLSTPLSCFDCCLDEVNPADDEQENRKLNLLSLGGSSMAVKTTPAKEVSVDDFSDGMSRRNLFPREEPTQVVYSNISDDTEEPALKKEDLDHYLEGIEQDVYDDASHEALLKLIDFNPIVEAPPRTSADVAVKKKVTGKALPPQKKNVNHRNPTVPKTKTFGKKASKVIKSNPRSNEQGKNVKKVSKNVKVQKKDVAKQQKGNKQQTNVQVIADSPPMLEMERVRGHLQNLLHPTNAEELNIQDDESFHFTTLQHHHPSEPADHHVKKVAIESSEQQSDDISQQMILMLKQAKLLTAKTSLQNNNNKVTNEVNILQDTLERERYRRKHCEKEIQTLQKRILEIRQELAVAESVEAKKDAMVQQLDKMLLQMLAGWKNHEKNLISSMQRLASEKEKVIDEKKHLKQMISSLEDDLANVLEELEGDKMKLMTAEEKHMETKKSFQSTAVQIQRAIEEKNNTINKCMKEKELLQLDVSNLKQRLADAHLDFEKQGKIYCKEEAEWNKLIISSSEKHEKEIDEYRGKLRAERERADKLEEDIRRRGRELEERDDMIRKMKIEKDEIMMKMETEMKTNETNVKQLKEEHNNEMKEIICEELEKAQRTAHEKEQEIMEKNKKQVLELIDSHRRELQQQHGQFELELQKKEASFRRASEEIERSYHQKLDQKCAVLRDQMKARMQNLFQTHYDETLKAMGDSAIPDENSPTICRSYSNTKHVMISIPSPTSTTQLPTQPSSSSNTSILQQPLYNPTPTSSSFSLASVDNLSSHQHHNHHNISKPTSNVDSLIEAKSKSLLSSLDQKLLDLQNSNILTTTQSSIFDENKTKIEEKSSSHLQQKQDDLVTNFYKTSPTHMKVNFSSSVGSPKKTDEKKLEDITSTHNSLDEEEEERKRRLEHYVQRLLNLRPAEETTSTSISSADPSNSNSSLKSSLQSSNRSNTSTNTSTDKYPVRQQKCFEHLIEADNSDEISTDFTESMRPKQTVRFAVDEMDGCASRLEQGENLQPHDTQKANVEIAQLLGMYVSSQSPATNVGTKKAASNLLEYLKQSPPLEPSKTQNKTKLVQDKRIGNKRLPSSPTKSSHRIWK